MLSAPASCPFAPRCRYVIPTCTEELPPLEPIGSGTEKAACFNPVPAEAWEQSRLGGAA
jgi:ABC-type dipeptide/oligopeptide/nickel transport system ATPase component